MNICNDCNIVMTSLLWSYIHYTACFITANGNLLTRMMITTSDKTD